MTESSLSFCGYTRHSAVECTNVGISGSTSAAISTCFWGQWDCL